MGLTPVEVVVTMEVMLPEADFVEVAMEDMVAVSQRWTYREMQLSLREKLTRRVKRNRSKM